MKNIRKIIIDWDITTEFNEQLFASKIDYDVERHNAIMFFTFHCKNKQDIITINKIWKLNKI